MLEEKGEGKKASLQRPNDVGPYIDPSESRKCQLATAAVGCVVIGQ
jgi:hypothetical protein